MNSKGIYNLIKKEPNPLGVLIGALNLLKKEHGFEQDLLTPGFIKEWMVSEILGHVCHKTKHGADAYSADGTEKYEYLSCKEKGSFQIDRIHENNLHRVERNDAFYFALFDKKDGLSCKGIWKGNTDVVLELIRLKISTARKESSKHVSITLKWVKENCEKVY